MTTCPRCTATWAGTSASHCTVCHQTFSVDSNADRHRKGTHSPDTRHCVDPASVGLVLNRLGRWAKPGPAEAINYTQAQQ